MAFDAWVAIRDFLEMGGPVLGWIAVTIFAMWALIVERMLYLHGGRQELLRDSMARWEERAERRSWNAHRIREALISRTSEAAHANVPLIKALVALCPLLGLLGTVTGMIEVFEVLSVAGTGNARSMAAGVARATVPTMAGMVGALSGVFAVSALERQAARTVERLDARRTLDT